MFVFFIRILLFHLKLIKMSFLLACSPKNWFRKEIWTLATTIRNKKNQISNGNLIYEQKKLVTWVSWNSLEMWKFESEPSQSIFVDYLKSFALENVDHTAIIHHRWFWWVCNYFSQFKIDPNFFLHLNTKSSHIGHKK